jgi:hypothetical protein
MSYKSAINMSFILHTLSTAFRSGKLSFDSMAWGSLENAGGAVVAAGRRRRGRASTAVGKALHRWRDM